MYFCNPVARDEEGRKQCNVCKEWKDESEFGKNRTKKDGLSPACLVCQRAAVRASKERKAIPRYVANYAIRNEQGQKFCTKCKTWRNESEFGKNSTSKDGLSTWCRECQKIYDMSRAEKRNEQHRRLIQQKKEAEKRYDSEGKPLQKCSCCGKWKMLDINNFALQKGNINGFKGVCRVCVKKQIALRQSKMSPEEKERQRLYKLQYMENYRKEHREEINAKKRKENLSQMQVLSHTFSSALYRALRGYKSERHWEEFTSYSIKELKVHLESQFDENMTWENMGEYWEIDHIIPQNLFQFTTENDIQFKICWSLANLRPLEKIANKNRPKDGSDVPREQALSILGQELYYSIMDVE